MEQLVYLITVELPRGPRTDYQDVTAALTTLVGEALPGDARLQAVHVSRYPEVLGPEERGERSELHTDPLEGL